MESLRNPIRRLSKSIRRAVTSPTAIISKARAISNPFTELGLPETLPNSKLSNIHLRSCDGSTVSDADFDSMLKAVELLKDMYMQSYMDWDVEEKKMELRGPHQRFLIASHERFGERIAFLGFRWDVEEGQAVMYVYEIHVAECVRGNHVAFALMKYAEELCRKLDVRCIMLTVFNDNQPAMRLYRQKLGYVIDADSPSRHGYENIGYEILSKEVQG